MSVESQTQTVRTVIIAAGQSVSGAFAVGSYRLMAIFMPAGWTAADITFVAADVENGTFQDLFDDNGTEVNVKAAASRVIGIDNAATKMAALDFIKIRSGTAALPVTQVGARTFKVLLRS